MLNVAIRINSPGSWLYWSSNNEHGCGWRNKIDRHTVWTLESAISQLRIIESTMSKGFPELTLVPVASPKIEVCERDATALAEAIRIAINATLSLSFQDELRGILNRLAPPQGSNKHNP